MGLLSIFKELLLFAVKLTIIATSVSAQAKPDCQSNCGNINIPYPFGTGSPGCNISRSFFIRCNTTFNPPKAFLTTSNIEVLNISLDGYLRIVDSIGYDCYNSSGRSSYFDMWITLSKFPISHTRNKFTAIGCDTYAYVQGSLGHNYSTGCLTFCNEITDVINGSCSGIGCCQTAIPKGVRSYHVTFYSSFNHSYVLGFNPCSYGFVVEDGAYSFFVSDLYTKNFTDREFPIILDWTIGNQTCTEAKMDPENYACKENSYCIDPENGPGYLCKCLDGFQGNPYLSNGCQDINECDTLKPCNGTCNNVPGSYSCSCPEGFEGDGWKNGTGCSPKVIPHRQSFPFLVVALGISVSLLSSLSCLSWVYLGLRQRKLTKLKQKNFQQNGGILLREQLSKLKECGETGKIFTADELEKATNNYHETRILGKGGQGSVYKGILPDGRRIAIKKSVIGDQSQVQQFINEVNVLSQINHRNVVKLLGCCLETQVPLLVYEYARNGTLFDHLHNAAYASVISWETRLKIATQTAEALAYLHSAASPPIIHRDVKLTNILLDENYNTKVSDFCASRLVPSDKTQVTTLVQGTLGYLDPEYLHTSQLTKKSDVYSFGVVLIELLTGLRVLSFERPEQERNLSMYFVSAVKGGLLLEILDRRVLNEKNIEQLKEVATLARRCVRVKGEERPTMKEVVSELEGLLAMEKHLWGKGDLHEEDAEHLPDEPYKNSTRYDGSISFSMGPDSIKNQVSFEVDGAR
ncbi:putative wall-associated receptor kinase-like 16 [Durio zibethinus]|uniref:Wall-associated receptor kinase-like 16 n=1 Tax=Durio zibethinus TaxID=66656 RepID=A0A6P6AM13_DURZI|nr:putative wall-associated receptor kinase-like 16 [Durio zibethinus]